MKKKLGVILSIALFYLIFAIPAYAQITQLQGSGCLIGGNSKQVATLDCLPIIITNIVTVLLVLAGIVAVFMIIYSGLKFVTSGGDAKQAEGARKTLTFAVIGLVVVMLVFVIVPAIASVTGIKRECLMSFGFSQCVPEDISFACSDAHPNGFCNGGKTCVESYFGGGRPVTNCQYLCEGNQKAGGWCPNRKDCQGKYNENLGKVIYKCK